MSSKKSRTSAHARITEQLLAMMDEGTPLFRCPWYRGGDLSQPTNARTQHAYRGVNVLALWARATEREYPSGLWATYRQWASLGAQVRRGESGTTIVFYKSIERDDDDERSSYRVARASTVFAAEQVDNLELPTTQPVRVQPRERVDALVRDHQVTLRHGGARAYYARRSDHIQMPDITRFSVTEAYYAVLAHELIHWTGHVDRCDRNDIKEYAFEELVAELGAAFLCADLGISPVPREDHAAYIASWVGALRSDDNHIARAASLASQAVRYLLSAGEGGADSG